MIKTTSLELSKQLKEAGFPQETYWIYLEWQHRSGLRNNLVPRSTPTKIGQSFPAPTAEEILGILPGKLRDFKGKQRLLVILKTDEGCYYVGYECSTYDRCKEKKHIMVSFEHSSLAEAAGKMYLYLAKEGLLSQ